MVESTGDDFNLSRGTMKSFPVSIAGLVHARGRLLEAAEALEVDLNRPENLLFTPCNKLRTGSWDVRRVRPATRAFDALVLEALGLMDFAPAVFRASARFGKSTGERNGTERGTAWLASSKAALLGDAT